MRKFLTLLTTVTLWLSLGMLTPASAASPLEYRLATPGAGCYVVLDVGKAGTGCLQTSPAFIGVHDFKADGKSVAVHWRDHATGRRGLCRLDAGASTAGRCGVYTTPGQAEYRVGTCDWSSSNNCTKLKHYNWFIGWR